MAGLTPESPGTARTIVLRMEQQPQQMQVDQGIFATAMNAELQTANNRMMAMESTIRDREQAELLKLQQRVEQVDQGQTREGRKEGGKQSCP